MDRLTFNKLREIVYDHGGIALREGKEALVSARVGKRMRALGIQDHRTYLQYVTQDKSGEEVVQLLDAISTNVTNFFRESDHFAFLGNVFSEWLSRGQRRFRFWSAACSTGEEAYSLAMTLLDTMHGLSVDSRILATDISTRAVEISMTGVYPKEKIKDVPLSLRARYFDLLGDHAITLYAAKRVLREMIVFKRLNLAGPPFPMRGPLDAVFCRNVMIYFDNEVRRNLLAEIHRLLRPGGYLMVGHAESLTGLRSPFKTVKPSIYLKE